MKGAVYRTEASVSDRKVELLKVLLKVEEEVTGGGRVEIEVVVVVKTVGVKVSSSVIWDFSVTASGVVVSKASVTSTDVSVTASRLSDVLLLTVEGAAVKPK